MSRNKTLSNLFTEAISLGFGNSEAADPKVLLDELKDFSDTGDVHYVIAKSICDSVIAGGDTKKKVVTEYDINDIKNLKSLRNAIDELIGELELSTPSYQHKARPKHYIGIRFIPHRNWLTRLFSRKKDL